MYRKCGYCIIVLFLLHCLPVSPSFTERLPAPALSFTELTFTSDVQRGIREAVHLQWKYPPESRASLGTFTLLRKFTGDSLFEVFSASREIPADTADFLDYLTNYQFPSSGFDTVLYQIVAIDTFGTPGDTSEACAVLLAPQPGLVSFDTEHGCLVWESWIRGGVFSWCTVRQTTATTFWTCDKMLEFPLTDEPATFTACVPQFVPGKWQYALYVMSGTAHSLTTGVIDVQ